MKNDFFPMPIQLINEMRRIIDDKNIDPSPPPPSVYSRSQIPRVKGRQQSEQDILKLKNNNIHIWILVHNLKLQPLKQTNDYKEFLKMYSKSKYFSQKFHVDINRINDVFPELTDKLQLSIKCLVYSSVITNTQLWLKAKPYLSHELVSEIIVKGVSFRSNIRQNDRIKCQQRFDQDFEDRDKYKGFVDDFNDALELDKKIYNLAMSSLKPNFFIINQYDTVEASDNLNSFHDILVNTKAYLKQSFDLKSKEKVSDSLESFQSYIWAEYNSFYQLYEKQKRQDTQTKKQKQKQILEKFFNKVKKTIANSYPFSNQDIQQQFYDDILRLYTAETVVYRSVNHLCKTVTSKEVFMRIAFFCKFLNLAIKKKGLSKLENGAVSKRIYKQRYYRGSMMSEIEWQSLIKIIQNKMSGYVINLAFTSTSRSQQVAKKFYKNHVKNNVLIEITINKLFFKYYNTQPYSNYLEYFYDLIMESNADQQEIIFNCFNVFKVLSFQNRENKIRVLHLQAFSHLQIIQKKEQGQKISEMQEKILDVIVRVQKTRDYAEQLKEQGKHEQMVIYLDKIVDNNVNLSVEQAENYIQFFVEIGQGDKVQKLIEKIQDNTNKTAEEQMKLAVYKTIKEEYLQSELFLSNALQKSPEPGQRENWEDLFKKCNLQHTLCINKQKIGAYEECFKEIQKNMNINYPQLQITQVLENIQTWSQFYKLVLESQTKRAKTLKQQKHKFDIFYESSKSFEFDKQLMDQRIKQFLTLEIQTNFFIQFFQHQRSQILNNNDLRRDFENYKNQFYERVKLKIKMLMFYYQVLIKCERVQMFKTENKSPSHVLNNLFVDFFETNKNFFQLINNVYEAEPNEKYNYQKSLFLKQYGKYLNGYYNFFSLNKKEKENVRKKISQAYQTARSYLSEINKQHEQLVNIQEIQDNMLDQRFFSEKIMKRRSIYQSINSEQESVNQIDPQQLISLAQSLKKSRLRRAKTFSRKNSNLNQNLCYSSILKTNLQIIESSNDYEKKQTMIYDFQKLANKIQSNMNSNVYLRQHTSNAFNDYLRASFWFLRGQYQASMVFIGKSEDILNNKLKSTQQRMLQQKDLEKKEIIRKKIQTIKQNNEVRIKICILKSKICINYKPNIHNLCIKSLTDQESFIKQKLFEFNSALPEIYYYQAYLLADKKKKQQKINNAVTILRPKANTVKKQFLKYYTFLYGIVDGTSKIKLVQDIQQIAIKNKIALSKNKSEISINLIEDYQLYYLFKLQECAHQNRFSFLKAIQMSLQATQRMKAPLDHLIKQEISILFKGQQLLKYWWILGEVIELKFQNNMVVSHYLFASYFLYIQNIFNTNKKQAFQRLHKLILQLDILSKKSDKNKEKYGIKKNDNEGFEDKIKTILLYCLRFASENHDEMIYDSGSGISAQIYKQDFNLHKNKFFKGLF